MSTTAQMGSLNDYVHIPTSEIEVGVEEFEVVREENSGQRIQNLEASSYVDVDVTSTTQAVRDLDTSFLDVNLTTEQTVGSVDTPNGVALVVSRGETHMYFNSTQTQTSNCGGEWLSVKTPGDQHATNARHFFLSSGIKPEIQRQWLIIGPNDQPITRPLDATGYKYIDSASNEFIGFYLFRICAGSFNLYCRVGLRRSQHNDPKLCKLSSRESDIC